MIKIIDPLANAFVVNPSQTATVSIDNGAKIVDTREARIEALEKQVADLKFAVRCLEERVYGYHDEDY